MYVCMHMPGRHASTYNTAVGKPGPWPRPLLLRTGLLFSGQDERCLPGNMCSSLYEPDHTSLLQPREKPSHCCSAFPQSGMSSVCTYTSFMLEPRSKQWGCPQEACTPPTTKHTGVHMFPSLALIPHQASGGTQTSTPRAAMCRSVQIYPSASIQHAWYHDGQGLHCC